MGNSEGISHKRLHFWVIYFYSFHVMCPLHTGQVVTLESSAKLPPITILNLLPRNMPVALLKQRLNTNMVKSLSKRWSGSMQTVKLDWKKWLRACQKSSSYCITPKPNPHSRFSRHSIISEMIVKIVLILRSPTNSVYSFGHLPLQPQKIVLLRENSDSPVGHVPTLHE